MGGASEGGGLPMLKGVEGGADRPSAHRLLHPEVIHHTPLDLLLCWCKQKTTEHSQLKEREGEVGRHIQTHRERRRREWDREWDRERERERERWEERREGDRGRRERGRKREWVVIKSGKNVAGQLSAWSLVSDPSTAPSPLLVAIVPGNILSCWQSPLSRYRTNRNTSEAHHVLATPCNE